MKTLFENFLEAYKEYGIVTESQHNSATVEGLPNIGINEIVIFENGEIGQTFVIKKENIGVLVYAAKPIKPGMKVARTKSNATVVVGKDLLGKVVNPFGNQIDGDKFTGEMEARYIHSEPAELTSRAKITKPFHTGTTIIDLMLPLGMGQRELVIGDRKTGKSSLLLTSLKTQVKSGSIGIYALIGKRRSDLNKLQEFCTKEGIDDRTIIVYSASDEPASIIHQTPYSAMTIAEYFRDQGVNSVVILDDLSTHAKFYREMSLLNNVFPGRESYPGDIFYIHSRLLERAGNFLHSESGEVSITCLPVAETIDGDLSSYISTNLMGMTDGHIFFDINEYNLGRRPAVNAELSVTRVGKQTQSNLKKELNTELNKILLEFKKMENFSHFGSELSDEFTDIILTGERLYSFFNQNYTEALSEEAQIIIAGFILNRDYFIQPKDGIAKLKHGLLDLPAESSAGLKAYTDFNSLQDFLFNLKNIRGDILTLCKIS